MKGTSVVALTIGIVLVVIALFVSTTLIIHQKGMQKVLGNETIFNLYCSNITMKYGCDLSKMEEQELNKFLEICKWEFGNKSIDPAKCIEKCGCSEKILDALNIFKKYTGIDCGEEYCHATQHGLYAQILKLINKEGIEEGDRVFYIDAAGNYHECFRIDTEEGFFIRFTDGSSYNCGSLCRLEQAPPDSTPGEKKVDFVSDSRNNKVYLKGIQGFVWKCENCVNGKFPIEDVPLSIEITEIEKPGWFGGTGKFKFRVEPCALSRPYPEVETRVYVFSPEEEEVHSGSTVYLYSTYENFKINITLNYIDYYTSGEEGKADVYFDIITEKKDYLDFSTLDANKAFFVTEFEDSEYHRVFGCTLLPGEKCSISFSENLPLGKVTKITILTWAYSKQKLKCIDGVERNYTYPDSNKCVQECYFTSGYIDPSLREEVLKSDIKRIESNCDQGKFEIKIYKGY